jgi:hypothetical protein
MYLCKICGGALFSGLVATLILGLLSYITTLSKNSLLYSDVGESTVEINVVRVIIILYLIVINFQ